MVFHGCEDTKKSGKHKENRGLILFKYNMMIADFRFQFFFRIEGEKWAVKI